MRLTDFWREKRNALVASKRFQELAVQFWPLRGEANRRAKSVFDLCAGFVYSQVLMAAVELGLLEKMRQGPLALDELAASMDLPEAGAERLVLATAALKLVEPRGTTRAGIRRFGLGMQGAALLGNPGALAMIAHHKMFYADMADPVALLRGKGDATALSRYWAYARAAAPGALAAADIADYSALMAASQPLVAGDILRACTFEGHRRLLDIGGGEGAFLVAVAKANPSIELMLFDLPEVAARAKHRFADAGLDGRASCVGGSFKSDPLPEGADAVSLIRVVHDHDDETVENLFLKIHAALPENGLLLIGEPMAEQPGAESMGDAYFGFYLLAMGSGRPRAPARLEAMLSAAGFAEIRHLKTPRPLLASVVTARKTARAHR